MKRPNIIFVQCDSMDGRAFGAMGLKALEGLTPALDSLAEQGTMFANTYSNNPICVCSRASMWSGQYTFDCHGWNNYKGIPKSMPTFSTCLAQGGYTNGIFGKIDIISGEHTVRARVTAWTRSAGIARAQYSEPAPTVLDLDEPRVHKNDWETTEQACAFLREHAGDEQPFFLYMGLNMPHPRFLTSRFYYDRIDQSLIELPPQEPPEHPAFVYQNAAKAWKHGLDDESVRRTRAIYYAMIMETDAMTAQLMRAAKDAGVWDNSYFVFCSDHGEMAMEHGQFYKMNHYEPSARVPMLIKGPGTVPCARREELVSLVDVFPTLLDMSGAPLPPQKLAGRSLMPLMSGTDDPGRADFVFAEYYDSTAITAHYMIRRGNYKYMAFPGYSPLLFDLSKDKWEMHDLCAELPCVAADMEKLLRSMLDYENMDRLVKENDRDCFRVWRHEQKIAGTYESNMARCFSGWDHITPQQTAPWTDEDEQAIIKWMEATF